MAFWSKKAPPKGATSGENSLLAVLDRGAKINDLAARLRRTTAASKLDGSDVVAALQRALGYEVASMIARRNPNAASDTFGYIMDQVLDALPTGAREAAYEAANLPAPEPYGERDLTDEEFGELTNRIVNAATRSNVPITESVTATAKALGLIIGILSERPGVDVNGLILFAQQAIDQFAQEAIDYRRKTSNAPRELT